MKQKKHLYILLVLFTLSAGLSLTSCQTRPYDGRAAGSIPIQHNGRVKSFESFSRQTVELITGKESWQRKPAVDLILEALDKNKKVADWPWIRVRYRVLLSELGLAEERQLFSYNELVNSFDKIEALVQSSQAKRDRDIRPSKLEQEAESLFSRIIEVKNLLSGRTILVIPPSQGDVWASPFIANDLLNIHFNKMLSLYGEKKYEEFVEKTKTWTERVHEMTRQKFRKTVYLETVYFSAHPFQQAWIAYLLAFLLLVFFKKKTSKLRPAGILLLGLAIFFHTWGLVLRVLILERPPVSNMYESMIYMNWVLIIAAAIFSLVKKNASVASIGALISAIIMIYGNLLPIDTNLEVLVPVLRSNYWLTIHVMTIVSSYGVFALAMGLGHRFLFLEITGKLTRDEEKRSEQIIYRAIQIGVLLLGIGTVLGGVWANESWGRFWGWDPKETWALITFLGYLILVHLKHAKLMKSSTLATFSILGFLLVLMTWYGVNFVLGRGLHSYGQGSGGMIWVIYYLIFEALFLVMVFWRKLAVKPSRR